MGGRGLTVSARERPLSALAEVGVRLRPYPAAAAPAAPVMMGAAVAYCDKPFPNSDIWWTLSSSFNI